MFPSKSQSVNKSSSLYIHYRPPEAASYFESIEHERITASQSEQTESDFCHGVEKMKNVKKRWLSDETRAGSAFLMN